MAGEIIPESRATSVGISKMVFDAHDRAFAFFHGACARGIYDNLWTPPAAR